jgi:fibronectin type 3 domain-containing protein
VLLGKAKREKKDKSLVNAIDLVVDGLFKGFIMAISSQQYKNKIKIMMLKISRLN